MFIIFWNISIKFPRNIFQNDSLIELSSEWNVVIDLTSENRESIGGHQPISRVRRDKEAEKEDDARREKGGKGGGGIKDADTRRVNAFRDDG